MPEREAYIKQIFDYYACIAGLMETIDNKVSLNNKTKSLYILQQPSQMRWMLFIWEVSRYKWFVTQSYMQVRAGGYRRSTVFDTQGLADVTR